MLFSLALAVAFIAATLAYPLGKNTTDPFADLTQPFVPSGGIGTDPGSVPNYHPLSDWDYQSLALALNQELIELDLFYNGLAKFSEKDFEEAGLTKDDRELIKSMALQEVGHARVISNMLGPTAPKACKYKYPYNTVQEFISFCQDLTRWGESGVFGFLEHMDSRSAALLLLQSISVEARQQMAFRQFQGLQAMPYDHITAAPQAFAWSALSRYIDTCPAENPYIEFQIFPELRVMNNANATFNKTYFPPAINHYNRTLSKGGQRISLEWDTPGKPAGYATDNDEMPLYSTNSTAGQPKYVAWVSQLNTTYTDLHTNGSNSGWTFQPKHSVFNMTNHTNPIVNGTMFVLVTDKAVPVTSFNLTQINPHVVAGPAMYHAG